MNKAIIMGRLTRDPELKTTQSGVPVVSFTVAVDRAYKPKDGEREADFINCVAWRQTAEFVARWFTKGKMIAVSGSIQTRKYTDRDNNQRNVTEIVAEDVYFCGDRSNERQGGYGDGGGERRNYPSRDGGHSRGEEPATQFLAGDFADLDDDDELPFIK